MKPRLANSAKELWDKIYSLNKNGVLKQGCIRYPVIDAHGTNFLLDKDNHVKIMVNGEHYTKQPSQSDLNDLDDAIQKDQVQVILLTQAGYESNYGNQKVLEILHSPSGFSWK